MNATSQTNPELVAVLAGARPTVDYLDHMTASINNLADRAKQNTFIFRSPQYSRETWVTALLLAGDVELRKLARDKGIDLRAFDNIIGQTQQLIIDNTNKPAPGQKVAIVLRKLSGI